MPLEPKDRSSGNNDKDNGKRKDINQDGTSLPDLPESDFCERLQDFLPGAINLIRVHQMLTKNQLREALIATTQRPCSNYEFASLMAGNRILGPQQIEEFSVALNVVAKNVYQTALTMARNSTLSPEEVTELLHAELKRLRSSENPEEY